MDGRVEGEEVVKAAVMLRDPTVDGGHWVVLYGTRYASKKVGDFTDAGKK